jgi:hypothetical protein
MPPFLALNLRKKNFFYYSLEAYIVHLAKGIRIFGQGKHHIHVIIQNVKKRAIFSIEKKYGAFNRGILIRFLRNILHLKKKHYFFHNFQFFFIFEI